VFKHFPQVPACSICHGSRHESTAIERTVRWPSTVAKEAIGKQSLHVVLPSDIASGGIRNLLALASGHPSHLDASIATVIPYTHLSNRAPRSRINHLPAADIDSRMRHMPMRLEMRVLATSACASLSDNKH
jgi:hypothetical protein